MLIKYTFASKSQTLGMRYPFQSTGRPISHRNGWSFRVHMKPLRDFVPEWNSRPGARTGMNSRGGDSRRHNILWWYHVNKYRAMRGNWSELAPGWKSPRCHVNTPLEKVAGNDQGVPKLWTSKSCHIVTEISRCWRGSKRHYSEIDRLKVIPSTMIVELGGVINDHKISLTHTGIDVAFKLGHPSSPRPHPAGLNFWTGKRCFPLMQILLSKQQP